MASCLSSSIITTVEENPSLVPQKAPDFTAATLGGVSGCNHFRDHPTPVAVSQLKVGPISVIIVKWEEPALLS